MKSHTKPPGAARGPSAVAGRGVPGRVSGVLGIVLACLALAIAIQSVGSYRRWQADLAELLEIAETTGALARRPDLARSFQRDADGTRASLRLARILLADELDRSWIDALPAEDQERERAQGVERLDEAHRLGELSLARRPGSWEALMVTGGSNYLRLTRRRDSRLHSQPEIWRGRLEEAHRLAPTQQEPLRLLAAALLGNWSVLSDDERQRAEDIFSEAFKDPSSFDLLATSWLRVAPSLSRALALVPDSPAHWSLLMRYFRRQEDWERYATAKARYGQVLESAMTERLEEARQRFDGDDDRVGVMRLRWVAATATPDIRHVALIERTLAAFPPGGVGDADSEWIGGWLGWTLERCLEGSTCPLDATAIRRLLSLSPELDPAVEAWGRAAAGDLLGAEEIERSQASIRDRPAWPSYAMAKARLLADRGEPAQALAQLKTVPLAEHASIRYWWNHLQVASAAGDSAERTRASDWLATIARSAWRAEDWEVSERRARLTLYTADSGRGLRLKLRARPNTSGAVEIRWDGSSQGTVSANNGRVIRLEVPVAPGYHSLEIHWESRSAQALAEVQLLPPMP